jgi:hypothetical protein
MLKHVFNLVRISKAQTHGVHRLEGTIIFILSLVSLGLLGLTLLWILVVPHLQEVPIPNSYSVSPRR